MAMDIGLIKNDSIRISGMAIREDQFDEEDNQKLSTGIIKLLKESTSFQDFAYNHDWSDLKIPFLQIFNLILLVMDGI